MLTVVDRGCNTPGQNLNFFDDQITKTDSLPPGENLKNCVVNPIVKKNVEELKMKTAKKIKTKLTTPSTKPQDTLKTNPKCEEQFPSRDELARMEKPPGRVETDLNAAVVSRETSQPGRSTVTPRK